MSKKILLGCYEVPGYGGAATSCYRLFRNLQQDGFDVAYINLINQDDEDYFRFVYGDRIGNPGQLENVYNCILRGPLFSSHPELTKLIEELAPDLMLGDGFIAALLMKKAFPGRPMLLSTNALSQATRYVALHPKRQNVLDDLKRAGSRLPCLNPREKEAFERSDFIITHSDMVRDFVCQIFPRFIGKVYSNIVWRAEWIVQNAEVYKSLARPFAERDIDLIFIASSWQRPEKNLAMVKKLVSRNRSLDIHIVGELDKQLGATTCHGLVSNRQDLFALLGRTRTLVCPSLFDAAPGVLFEASVMGCNVVAAKNSGNWQLCNSALLVDPYNVRNFQEKIACSLTRKFDDNLDLFIKTRSYHNLINIMGVFLDGLRHDSNFPFYKNEQVQ